jgi:ABC-2 type transport system ATP-binding protein/Cu-processing system ATP-binding protein
MLTKKVKCPKCKHEVTINGMPGQKVEVLCSNCGTHGVFIFPNGDLSQGSQRDQASIDVQNLSKYYNDLKAVNNISFTVKKGEVFGFLGPNGAGKTTTIKSILGLVKINSGIIKINGINSQSHQKEAKRNIGYLPEKVAFYENLSAIQNLKFYAEMKGASVEECKSLIEEFGLSESINKKVGKYSKGMVQRLGMARSILGNPPILILDEPTGGLDPRGVLLIRNKIKEMQNQGTTIFVSSHILSEIQEVCNRVGIINKGVIVAEDSVSNLGTRLRLKPRLIIELDNIQNDIVDRIKEISGVEKVSVENNSLDIICTPRSKVNVILAIEKAKGKILNIKTKETSLEDVFMKFTEENQ